LKQTILENGILILSVPKGLFQFLLSFSIAGNELKGQQTRRDFVLTRSKLLFCLIPIQFFSFKKLNILLSDSNNHTKHI
jgi:hypothetical protein